MYIDEDILSDVAYAICKAISEIAGRSGITYVSMVGKNMLKLAEEKGAVSDKLDDPLKSLNKFLKFFVDLEYADRIEAKIENDVLRIEFKNIKFFESEVLLKSEKSRVLPLYVTFAARAFLEKYFSMNLIYHDYEQNEEEKIVYGALKIL
jgi:hypothetical protein